ncbi:PepSY domain-containing protein [Rhizobium sp. C4]|uniref:PepSY domain-containing protein n=1 Tax=Rhizobium sp. C4 TaxID=1349800 RepID=UPI001E63BA68|nr:PepSY domain-containing protein [Rhizobium sp. C4]MCD2174583.1 PepSY domain-containing protein [Rhizobium sp. C4]
MYRPVPSLLIAVAALALAGSLAHADSDDDGDEGVTLDAIQRAVENGTVRPLSDLKAIVAERFPGDIVRIEPRVRHGNFTYEFKVLQGDGRLVEIHMDARTGRILKTENE